MKIMDSTNKIMFLEDQIDEFEQKGLENHEKQIETEIIMRTSNNNFNWILIDINGIMSNRGKA